MKKVLHYFLYHKYNKHFSSVLLQLHKTQEQKQPQKALKF